MFKLCFRKKKKTTHKNCELPQCGQTLKPSSSKKEETGSSDFNWNRRAWKKIPRISFANKMREPGTPCLNVWVMICWVPRRKWSMMDCLRCAVLFTAAAENLPNPRATTLGDDTAKVHGTNLLNSYATTLPAWLLITIGISYFLIITGASILKLLWMN